MTVQQEEWEEHWEEEDSEGEDHLDPESGSSWTPAHQGRGRASTSLALGFLAMIPMFVAYEYSLAVDPSLPPSQSEQVLFRILVLFPDLEVPLRRAILLIGAVVALVLCYRRRLALVPSLIRIGVEGFFGALALGPALALGMRLFGGFQDSVAPLAADTSVPVAARVFGAAAFEELLFRVAIYGALFVLLRRVLIFFGSSDRSSSWAAEALAALGSSVGFAAIHLSVCTAWLGSGGEPFDPAIFAWRFLAGLMLALLFRWRGPGVAAWSHGLFNLALLIGAGPEIFL